MGLGAASDPQIWCRTWASPSIEILGSGPSHREESRLSALGIAGDVSEWFFSSAWTQPLPKLCPSSQLDPALVEIKHQCFDCSFTEGKPSNKNAKEIAVTNT